MLHTNNNEYYYFCNKSKIDDNGNRQCRESIFIVGKKNGKSLLASIVGLYLLIADGEPGAEIYAVATKREQANIIWEEAKRMVLKSAALRKRIKPLVSKLSSEEFNNGVYRPLASDKDSLDGLNVHGCMMDEIHQWKNGKALYDIMADGVTARDQPLIYIKNWKTVQRILRFSSIVLVAESIWKSNRMKKTGMTFFTA